MRRPRLATKITVLIVGVLIVGFGTSTIFTIRREAEMLVEQSKVSARRLAETLVASIEAAMLEARPDVTRMMLAELRSASPVEGLTIYRRNGVEAFTDLATVEEVRRFIELPPEVLANIERMRRPPTTAAADPLFRRAVQTLETQEAVEPLDGVPHFTLYRPVPNRANCQGCHGRDHQVRAVVRIATSMAPVFTEVRRHRNRQIAIAALTIVAAGAVLSIAMRRVVVRPIEALAAAARRIGMGHFDTRAPSSSGDELGQLGTAFNEMTERLARAAADLAAKNEELGRALESLQESRQRVELLEQIQGQLAKFVPDAVTRLLARDPNATELEKRTVEVSVLFLDVAGYTRLSEQLDPRKLNQLVQIYFSSFLEIIRGYHGDVNETAGDGLMVIFQEREGVDHALEATRAAFAVRQRAVALNDEYSGVFPAVQLRMGINTGEALVGATKLGGPSGQRWTFTASGPTTNVAARLADTAAGGEIIVGPVTAERIHQHFVLEDLGARALRNVSAPVRLYRVIPPGVYEKVT